MYTVTNTRSDQKDHLIGIRGEGRGVGDCDGRQHGHRAYMDIHTAERLAVFIDGPELRGAVAGIGIDVDFKKIHRLFEQAGQLLRITFYHIEREDDEDHSMRPLTDWLEYNGYTTVACQGREGEAAARRGNKNFLNVRLAVDALGLAEHVDHIVIFSGDAVLGPLVDALKLRGCRVSIFSTVKSRPLMIADDLRRRADQFVDLAHVLKDIAKDQPPEKAKVRRTQPEAQQNA